MPAAKAAAIAAPAGPLDFSQFTHSAQIMSQLQAQYGTMQPGKLQALRKQFYSYIMYPLLGSVQLNFFGQALGNAGATLEETNMPVQGSFGTSAFLLKGIMCNYKITAENTAAYAGTDASTLTSEFLGNLFRAGVLELVVNAKTYLQIRSPWLQAPPADGRTHYAIAGQLAGALIMAEPSVNLSSRSEDKYYVDPEIFIAAQQNFAVQIGFPSGALPVLAAGIITGPPAGVPLYLGVVLDGIEFRPVQ
jgi:hypothetical protein